MTTIQKPFSLPDVLMSIYNTPKFRKELLGSAWLNAHRTICNQHVREHILNIMNDNSLLIINIINEYGYFGDFETYFGDETDLTGLLEYTQDNFEIYLHPSINGHNHMYYKILPKGATKENCAFLQNPQKFDGFLCHKNHVNTYNGNWEDGYQQIRGQLKPNRFPKFPRLAHQWVG